MHTTTEWLLSFKNEQLKKNCGENAKMISFTGAKGGVGKTTLSLKFAFELIARQKKVLLIDCDYNLANVLIKLRMPLKDDFYDLYKNKKSIRDCLVRTHGLDIISGCNGNTNLLENDERLLKTIMEIVKDRQNDYDYILIDCPAGLNTQILFLNAYSDYRVFIVNPDKSSLTDAYSLMKVLKINHGVKENHVLFNKVKKASHYQRSFKSLSETAENFLGSRTVFLGALPQEDLLDQYDYLISRDEKNSFQRKLINVIDRFSDQEESAALVWSKGSALHHEQGVHPNI